MELQFRTNQYKTEQIQNQYTRIEAVTLKALSDIQFVHSVYVAIGNRRAAANQTMDLNKQIRQSEFDNDSLQNGEFSQKIFGERKIQAFSL